MADHAGLLEAIANEPEDNVPRLIYADWLEEHGEPERGEFIRARCLADSLPWDEQRDALEDRADDLLFEHELDWLGPLVDELDGWRFWRGFLSLAILPCGRLRYCVDDLARLGPDCRVKLLRPGGDTTLATIMRMPELTRITGLDVTAMLTEAAAPFVARSPCVDNLRLLDISSSDNTGYFHLLALEELFSNPHYAKLRSLRMESQHIGPRGIKALAESTVLTQLRFLGLSGNPLYHEGVRPLANAPGLSHLTSLDLSDTGVFADSLKLLAESPHLAQLRNLTILSRRAANLEGIELLTTIIRTGLLGRLERLSLSLDGSQHDILGELARWDIPCRLKSLSLRHGLLQAGGPALDNSPALFANLETLDLTRSAIGEGQLHRLLRSDVLGRLGILSLAGTRVGESGVHDLVSGGCLPQLRFLDMSGTELDNGMLPLVLTEMPTNRLRLLNLADNPLEDFALEILAGASLGRVRELDLSRVFFSPQSLLEFLYSSAMPRLRVLRLRGSDLEGMDVEEVLKSPMVQRLRMLDLSSTRGLYPDDIADLQDALDYRVDLTDAGNW